MPAIDFTLETPLSRSARVQQLDAVQESGPDGAQADI